MGFFNTQNVDVPGGPAGGVAVQQLPQYLQDKQKLDQATAASQGPAPVDRSLYDVPGATDMTQALQNRQAAVLGRTPDSDVRQQQMALAQQLQRYATGQDSASALQLQQARDQNVAANLAMAAGARPGQQQLASLTAAQQMGAANT